MKKKKIKVLGTNKQALTKHQIYELLKKQGFPLSYSTVVLEMNLYVNIKRIDGNKKISADIRHYLKTLIFKPGALRNLFVLKSNPKLKTIFDKYYTNNPKKFIDIIEKNKEKDDTDLEKILITNSDKIAL